MDKENVTIELRNLTTGYHAKKQDIIVSNGLNAKLRMGEMTCLLGPNGAGKSTLLRTLAAFQPSIGGDVLLMNRNLKNYKNGELSHLISVVLTDNSRIRNMTAYDVVAIGRSPYTGFWGKLSEKDKKIVEKCLQWVGITELAERKMQTLSDGERQKVMIAKAIAQETPIIFLDEPTAFLDYPSKIGMMLLLHRLAKALKKTIFLSTHDLEHALQVADQVWLIDREKGLTTGMPEDLCAEGKIEEYFMRDGISFDRATCTFGVRHDTAREVIVEGNKEGMEYRLVCKAFIRNAIRPVDTSENNDVKVVIPGDGTYRMWEYGKETVCVRKIEHIVSVTASTLVKTHIKAVRDAANMTPYE
ncbi:MAG: ABC transporter ATP-binding protein [Bacteroides sp.]|nr:ABC transporter ATP-binding protein [Roseburia sp.]MCM1347691.1 ABC transporter ATP-binding protein [Bacteroides sp.]MCM1421168.1 ABC transporter ATP-binding protein [Bacteroides sp.]